MGNKIINFIKKLLILHTIRKDIHTVKTNLIVSLTIIVALVKLWINS